MTNCESCWELMSCAMDGALTDEERRRLEGHLAQCQDCRELFAQMQAVSGDMPGAEEAPAGFSDAVMAAVSGTEQEIPFTNLPQNRDIDKVSREKLRAWWRPIAQWCAIAACFLIICGVGSMANRSGLFSAENSSGASAPAEDSCRAESQTVADEAEPGANEKPDAAKDGFGTAEILEWDGASYISTGDTAAELPEGFAPAGECSLLAASSSQDGARQVYAGGGDEIYILVDDGYQRWIRMDE